MLHKDAAGVAEREKNEMNPTERLTMWQAWMELREIRARDGVPYKFDGTKSSVCEEYFSQVVDDLADCLGEDAVPWPPKKQDLSEFEGG